MKNWTVNAAELLQKAQNKAYELGHPELEPIHVLWALLAEPGLAASVIRALEKDPALIARTEEQELRSLPVAGTKEVPNPSPELQKLLLRAGYDIGEADGRVGAATREGISKAEARFGMPVTGRPGQRIYKALGGR